MDDKLINKRQVEFLTMAGVFDSFIKNRNKIFSSSASLLAISQNSQKDRESSQQALFGIEINNQNTVNILKEAVNWETRECLINEYLALGFFVSENPLIEKRPYFEKFNLSNSLNIENNKVNGKLFELIGFLVKIEERIINNKKVLDLLFIDEFGFFNLFVFNDNNEHDHKGIIAGESYVITVVNSIDSDRRMRLRLKTIRNINSFIKKNKQNVKIYLNNVNDIEKLKDKLENTKIGKNKVILVYNGYEIDTGIKVDNDNMSHDDLNLLDGVDIK